MDFIKNKAIPVLVTILITAGGLFYFFELAVENKHLKDKVSNLESESKSLKSNKDKLEVELKELEEKYNILNTKTNDNFNRYRLQIESEERVELAKIKQQEKILIANKNLEIATVEAEIANNSLKHSQIAEKQKQKQELIKACISLGTESGSLIKRSAEDVLKYCINTYEKNAANKTDITN